jgi:hypothetical protein
MRYNLLENLAGFFTDLNKKNKEQVFMNGSGSLICLNNLDFYMLGDKKDRIFTVVYRDKKNLWQRIKEIFKPQDSYCEIYWDEKTTHNTRSGNK